MTTGTERYASIDFEITTGDGTTYNPQLRLSGGASMSPNTSAYDKPNVEGTEVVRNSGSSAIISLAFALESELTEAFLESAKSPNKWSVTHPLFGTFSCHPTAVAVTTQGLNIHEWKVTVWRTSAVPISTSDTDLPYELSYNLDEIVITAQGIATELDTEELSLMETMISNLEEVYSGVMDSDAVKAFEEASTVINDTLSTASEVATAIQDVILLPNELADSAKDKLNLFKRQGTSIISTFEDAYTYGIGNMVEGLMSVNCAGAALASVNPEDGEFDIRQDVLNVANLITSINGQLATVTASALQANVVGDIGQPYLPSADLDTQTQSSITSASSGLTQIALDSKVSTTHLVLNETTIEQLAYELYGVASDDNMNLIIGANDLFGKYSLDSMLESFTIKEGKSIIYYV